MSDTAPFQRGSWMGSRGGSVRILCGIASSLEPLLLPFRGRRDGPGAWSRLSSRARRAAFVRVAARLSGLPSSPYTAGRGGGVPGPNPGFGFCRVMKTDLLDHWIIRLDQVRERWPDEGAHTMRQGLPPPPGSGRLLQPHPPRVPPSRGGRNPLGTSGGEEGPKRTVTCFTAFGTPGIAIQISTGRTFEMPEERYNGK